MPTYVYTLGPISGRADAYVKFFEHQRNSILSYFVKRTPTIDKKGATYSIVRWGRGRGRDRERMMTRGAVQFSAWLEPS
eukprot:4787880-Pyramimonas_sp.AAC.1